MASEQEPSQASLRVSSQAIPLSGSQQELEVAWLWAQPMLYNQHNLLPARATNESEISIRRKWLYN